MLERTNLQFLDAFLHGASHAIDTIFIDEVKQVLALFAFGSQDALHRGTAQHFHRPLQLAIDFIHRPYQPLKVFIAPVISSLQGPTNSDENARLVKRGVSQESCLSG